MHFLHFVFDKLYVDLIPLSSPCLGIYVRTTYILNQQPPQLTGEAMQRGGGPQAHKRIRALEPNTILLFDQTLILSLLKKSFESNQI